MSICRNTYANGWPRGRRPRAISSSKSTSIRRAFCSPTKRACRHLRRQAFLRNATLTRSVEPEAALLGDDLGGDAADAGTGQADGARCTRREVEDAPLDEGTAVVDGDDDALAAMRDAQLGAERQRAVGAGHGVLV